MNSNLVSDNTVLTSELILMNREVSKLKTELRLASEGLRKSEKERGELRKQVDSKQNMLDRVKRERDELTVTLSTDKYASVRALEEEKRRL